MHNIVLIGLPGSGKTTIGKIIAENMRMDFYDTDSMIEEQQGCLIQQIFESFGEKHFRNIESEVIRKVSARKGVVISTGGGVVLNKGNITELKKNGLIYFIDRDPLQIVHDIKTESRPLLKDGASKIIELSVQRRPLYVKFADMIINNNQAAERAASEICQALQAPFNYAVIGDPIGHTLSPLIHNEVFERLETTAKYGAFRIEKGTLGEWLERADNIGICGFNATIPHKIDIIPYLDSVEDDAKLCNSVNTVVIKNGKRKGYNTDMAGLAMALEHDGFGFAGQNIVVLGAGGAANAVCVKACLDGAESLKILVRDTSVERAEVIKQLLLAHKSNIKVKIGSISEKSLAEHIKTADLLMNTTPRGMTGIEDDFTSFDFLDSMREGSLVCDLIYSPPKTNLLEEAEKRGLKIQNGMKMLIYQALIADSYFLGREINYKEMYDLITSKIIENIQGGK